MIWFALFIPIIAIAVMGIFFHKRVVWWEFTIPLAVSIVCILIAKTASEHSQVTDKEYWGAYGVDATYYERWDEEVSCSHPIYESQQTGTDSKGNATYSDVYVGDEHLYDVDDHPPRWTLSDSNGVDRSISQGYWESLVIRWKNKTFRDMHRDYHSIDGDAYVTKWDSKDKTLEAVTSIHSYENRVQASDQSLFNFQEVTEIDRAAYELFEYPQLSGYSCQNILGNAQKKGLAERKLEIFNSKFGGMKQVRVFFLIYHGQPLEAALLQESYWKGGNKNEFTVCIGLDSEEMIQWCYVISWTEVDELKFAIRDEIAEGNVKLNLPLAVDKTTAMVKGQFRRKEFAEFSYLKVSPSSTAIIWTYIIVLFVSGGSTWWAVANQFDEDGHTRTSRFRGRRSRSSFRSRGSFKPRKSKRLIDTAKEKFSELKNRLNDRLKNRRR